MKLNNKFALLLAGAMLVGALTGCGSRATALLLYHAHSTLSSISL